MKRDLAGLAATAGLLLIGVAGFSIFALAQGNNSQDSKRPAQFKTKVDQVVIYASVYDAASQLVSGLAKEDFQIYEDKVLQQIDFFGVGDVPSTIGLVMDNSGSMKGKMLMVEEAVEIFLSSNSDANELFLVSFNSQASLEEPFTRDAEDIRDSFANLIVSGGTALYDAIFLAVDQAREGHEARKAIVVFTDGEDKDSYYTQAELIEKIEEEEVQIYLVAFLDETLDDYGGFFGVFKSQREKVTQGLNQIADASGGKAFFPEKPEELNEVFKTIAHELRNQYQLAYVSSNPRLDGSWRPIRVVVNSDPKKAYKVRAKKGYFAR